MTNTNPEARDMIAKTEVLLARGFFDDEFRMALGPDRADAIIAALAAEGMVIVPREPTDEMIMALPVEAASGLMGTREMRVIFAAQVRADWAAMLAALPTPTLPPAGDEE